MNLNPHLEHNRRAWDERAARRGPHTGTATEQEFRDPLAAVDDLGWLGGDVRGKRVMCLAAGGGRHGVLFAAAGAVVTVVDLSPRMLDLDRRMAAERGLTVRVVEAGMTDLSALPAAGFDIVIQPVSTCYVPDIRAVYREVARVTAPGALYISQHKQPACLQADVMPSGRGFVISEPYYRTGPLPSIGPVAGLGHREADAVEFMHRWEELLGELCRSGFVIEDVVEPRHADAQAAPGTLGHRAGYLPPFVTLKARRVTAAKESGRPLLWTP